MRDGQPPGGVLAPVVRPGRAQPVGGAQVYRPRLALSAAFMLTPALIALGAVGLSLLLLQEVPIAVPIGLGLLLPIVACAWLGVVSVRTSPSAIGAGRPLGRWRDMPWSLIAHASRRGPSVTLVGSDGGRLRFIPLLLQDGAQLYRELLLRLPTQVFDGRMANEARLLLAEHVLPTTAGGLTGSLQARPRTRWRAATLMLVLGALVAGAVGGVLLPPPASVGVALLASAALGGALLGYRWCAQTLVASDDGLTVIYPLPRKGEHMAWSEVQLLEHSPGERVLRLRGDRRLLCAGPALFAPAERDLLRAFLHTYCLDRGVPVARRRWLFPARGVRQR